MTDEVFVLSPRGASIWIVSYRRVEQCECLRSLCPLMKIFPTSDLGLTDVTGVQRYLAPQLLEDPLILSLIMSNTVQYALKMSSFFGHALMCKEFVRSSVKMKEDILDEERCFLCDTNYSTGMLSECFSHPTLDYS